jgi:hypothetical protein
MAKELPVYEVTLGDNLDFRYEKISLVDKPAIMTDWYAFSEQEKPYHFVVDEEKQILAGPFMIPDLPIYRIDETGKEFFVKFPKEVVRQLHYNFAKSNANNAINIMHGDEMAKASVIENWLIEDVEKDKSTIYGFKLPVGTSFGLVHIEDRDFWNKKIKTGELRGFSIEAMLKLTEKPVDTIKLQKFMEYILKDGTKIKVPQDIAEGSDIMVIQEDGSEIPAPDGEHMLEDGRVILVSGGKIASIKEEMAQDPADPATPSANPPAATSPNEEVNKYIDQKLADFKAEVTKTISEIMQKMADWEASKSEVAKVKEENAELKAQMQRFSQLPGVKSMFDKDDVKNNKEKNPNAKPDIKETVQNLRALSDKFNIQ